ncbi:MAG TPA: N,N-dimethylformamidase beta subunit family domain-containing protein, partial [Stellaceae bacterium]|nr:N,N-dimethylformamidase beta subunit family domain-containing protein [Stellaceae bacterium]
MTTLMGYADKISVAPGDTIGFKVSCAGAPRYRAEIVRVLSPEAGPDAPEFRKETVDTPANREYPAREQALLPGSFAMVSAHAAFSTLESFSIQAMIWPTLPGRGRQAILGTWSETHGSGFGLMLDAQGALELRLGQGGGRAIVLSGGTPLISRRWYFVAASFDRATGVARLYRELVADKTMTQAPAVAVEKAAAGFSAGPGPFLFAAWHRGEAGGRTLTGGHFNGKIDRPRLCNRALSRDALWSLTADTIPASLVTSIMARWDFSRDIETEIIRDTSPNRLDGAIVNLPARAMTGSNWDGSEMNWRKAPEQYGAIHFHDDDIADAGWETDFTFPVPAGLKSGCYAAWLTAGDARFQVAFFVRPAKGAATADIVYLASSATYTVYCNNVGRFRSVMTEVTQGRLTVMDAVDILLLEHPEMGFSTYDRHSDGSGICYSSRLRPATNIRPTGRLWNYCCDMLIVDWLDRSGLKFDVVTDDDLHQEGLDLIRPYRVLVTGSHPEYASLPMLDALDGWVRRGGRLMYLGGNGFYWRIAYHPTREGIIEVRRSEDGTRAWDAEVGEYYHSFSGEYGGLWRRQNRAPQALAGVGFISQGFDWSSPYRRTEAARDPRAAFIFAG